VVESLISNGNISPTSEELLLSLAASIGNLEVAEVLVRKGGNVSPKDTYRNTLEELELTIPGESTSTVQLIPTPLYVAAANGHRAMAEYLIKMGAGPDTMSPTDIFSFTKASCSSISAIFI
jgi:ankyrin repeat protein